MEIIHTKKEHAIKVNGKMVKSMGEEFLNLKVVIEWKGIGVKVKL